jgi:hypothetical protein
VGLIGVVTPKFLVMNGLDQLTSLSRCLLALYKAVRAAPDRARCETSQAGYCPAMSVLITPRVIVGGTSRLEAIVQIRLNHGQCTQ